MTSAPRFTATIVVPVKGHSELLEGFLRCLDEQSQPPGAVLLVDDSVEGDLVAPANCEVVRSNGVGPYAARNVGWRQASTEIVIFADARSRPRPRWYEDVLTEFTDPNVAMVCSDTVVLDGTSLASHAAYFQQSFRLWLYVENAFFMPYFPTCNLAVRRSALEAVSGFRPVRSGGDADLCWRIQRQGGKLFAIDEPLMDWFPRAGLRDYYEQQHRYGQSTVELRDRWGHAGAPALEVPRRRDLMKSGVMVLARTGWALLRLRGDLLIWQVVASGSLVNRLGVRTASLRQDRPDPNA